MAITYGQYAAGNTKIRCNPKLVLGFMVEDHAAGTEVLYEVWPDGLVRRTQTIAKPNHDFHKPGRSWFAAHEVPADAEFIGHYPQAIF